MQADAGDLGARLDTVSGFRDLVNAMRGVAAARAQQARERLAGTDRFAETVADALAQALTGLPTDDAKTPHAGLLRVVLCGEQGFTAGLDDQVLDTLAAQPEPSQALMLAGEHGLRLARARQWQPLWTGPMISHAAGAVVAAEQLHTALARLCLSKGLTRVELVHPAVDAHQTVTMRVDTLLPLDRATLRQRRAATGNGAHRPRLQLPPEALFEALATEFVSARLVQALLHTHAAENLARLRAMAAAHDNVEHMLDDLHAAERQQRQAAITEEIGELAAGLRALRRGGTDAAIG